MSKKTHCNKRLEKMIAKRNESIRLGKTNTLSGEVVKSPFKVNSDKMENFFKSLTVDGYKSHLESNGIKLEDVYNNYIKYRNGLSIITYDEFKIRVKELNDNKLCVRNFYPGYKVPRTHVSFTVFEDSIIDWLIAEFNAVRCGDNPIKFFGNKIGWYNQIKNDNGWITDDVLLNLQEQCLDVFNNYYQF